MSATFLTSLLIWLPIAAAIAVWLLPLSKYATGSLAVRGAAQATGGQILCTRQVADALIGAQTPDVEIEHQGSFSLKNLPHPVDLYEVVLSGCAREYAIDPVCKMQVDKRRAAGDQFV